MLAIFVAAGNSPLTSPCSPDRDVAERSLLIKNMLEDLFGEETTIPEAVPIPNVNEPVLKKVIEWCTHHRKDPQPSADDDSDNKKKPTEIDEWDQKFMQVDQEMLFEIILVSHAHTQADAPSQSSVSRSLQVLYRLPTISTSRPCWMSAARPWRT